MLDGVVSPVKKHLFYRNSNIKQTVLGAAEAAAGSSTLLKSARVVVKVVPAPVVVKALASTTIVKSSSSTTAAAQTVGGKVKTIKCGCKSKKVDEKCIRRALKKRSSETRMICEGYFHGE